MTVPHEERGVGRHFIRSMGGEVTILAQQVEGVRTRVQQDTAMHATELVHSKLECRDDSEVAAAAANSPKQIFMVGSIDGEVVAVGVDEVRGEDVVTAQAVLSHEPANAAAKREPTNAGGRDYTAGRGQPEFLTFAIELAPGGATLN